MKQTYRNFMNSRTQDILKLMIKVYEQGYTDGLKTKYTKQLKSLMVKK